jgi:hypothetical protein
MIYDAPTLIFLAAFGVLAFCAFVLGYMVRGTVDEFGGELTLLRQWWNKRKENHHG